MAFAATIVGRTVFGNKRILTGTFVNTSNTAGGDITTGFKVCDFLTLQSTNSASAVIHSVTETFPVDGGVVTVATTADVSGVWFAYGH